MIATDYFPCDDARAAELERDGWTIRRNANAGCHHGYYAPHMAVREVDTGRNVTPLSVGQSGETIQRNDQEAS